MLQLECMKGGNMMQRNLNLVVQFLISITFIIGALISSGACCGPYYQPEVPEKLRSKK